MRTVNCETVMKGSISGAFAKVFFWLLLLSTTKTLAASDTISPGQLIRDNETLVSTGATYELGFFSPGSSTRRYLGIWFKKSTETVVWVANREIPIGDRSGVLQIKNQGILVLVNGTKSVVWSSNVSRIAKSPVAQLLDSANFVVREENDSNPDRYLWQSFDYPGDTNLAGMKLGRNLETGHDWSLSSWKSLDDPARGEYTFGIDPRGYPQVMLKKGSEIQFRAGSWNGLRFTGARRLDQNLVFKFEFVLNEKEVYFDSQLINKSVVTRMVMEASGTVERFTWIDQTHSWANYFSTGQDLCNNYAQCGANAKCNSNNYVVCACLDGFEPKSPRAWSFRDYSQGCVRSSPLGCEAGEGFIKQTGMKLPDTSKSWYNMNMSFKECMDLCLTNCSCVASANADIRAEGSGCILWFGDLIDMREFSDSGQDLYVRMAASYIDHIRKQKHFRKAKRIVLIICFTIVFIGAVVLGWILYRRKRKLKLQEKMKDVLEIDGNNKSMKEDLELPTMELSDIAKATNNFSIDNKLGEGGFGPVYKGILPDGQEIAAKRLSLSSGQGLEEFINEVLLIAKLQHRNLVGLIGCCIQGGERMLIYEYMPNKSLDYFIFDQSRKKILDWQTRINIIDGIARGLLYLHQDSRLRIIHRDLKASNVLLDSVMNPKISDFGMARIVGGDQTEANTNRVVGTYGYMAPEYAVDGLFSLKSDIFSFGVLILEIVSGRRNRGFYSQNHHHNLVGYAWRLWMEDRPSELIDDIVGESTAFAEFIRCIHVGLLCVQHRPEDRPNISTVVIMLSGESSLPQPKQPGFFTERNLSEEGSSSSFYKSNSTNQITVTALDPR